MEQSVMYFGGTAARASAIPTPSTGMTTYIGVTGTATIPQIETYTGSEWQTPYGLTQVANVSFTTAAIVAFDNVFTSAYQNYRVIVTITAKSTNGHMFARLRASGTDNSTGNYNYGGLLGRTTNTTANYGASGAGDWYYAFSNASQCFNALDVINPQVAFNTQMTTTGHGGDLTTWFSVNGSGNFTTNAQFDGMSFQPSTGTISGNIKVYGYRNS